MERSAVLRGQLRCTILIGEEVFFYLMIDLTNIEALRTAEELCKAIDITYDSELDASDGFREEKRMVIMNAAYKLGCFPEVSEYAAKCKSEATAHEYIVAEVTDMCECDRRGKPLNITDNYYQILCNDPKFSHVRYNEMSKRPVVVNDDGVESLWTDDQDAGCRSYIEKHYGIHSVQKCSDALSLFFRARAYHPIKNAIEKTEWDGVKRIPYVLTKWMDAEDTEYTREVSRLIFAGGINRLYHPGCKFEDMPVLIGGQGAGKSSFVRFLAIEDRFFTELSTIEGKEGSEAIEGSWIVEVSELLALTKTKEQEAVKAYLSRQRDKFRPAFGRRVEERTRSCIFIGTSNRDQFITDKTGGRRFYPVLCTNTGYNLYDHEQECREYIRQCWAEALANINSDYMAPYAKREVKPLIEEKQAAATEDDYRVGMIEGFLEDYPGNYVYTSLLWKSALKNEYRPMQKADETQIGLIMRNINGWRRVTSRRKTADGPQRGWERVSISRPYAATYTTPNNDVPF